MKKAKFWQKSGENILCSLCARGCIIPENAIGFCGVRKNVNGILYSLNYGKAVAMHVDPIEKKPLFHFHPGTKTFSISTVGCNLSCLFCQNADISQVKDVLRGQILGEDVPPEKIITLAKNTAGISWTYGEPTIFYEYFYDTMSLLRNKQKNKKLYSVWVSNGFNTPEPIIKARKFIDAVNVDYKGPNRLYKELCSARLEPVQETLCLYKKLGIHVEITNLVIPGENDSPKDIKEMVLWIVSNLSVDVPLHFSRYHPYYKFSAPSTPVSTLEKAYDIARKELDYVYIGNVATDKENTYCPSCNTLLIERSGFGVGKINLDSCRNKCPKCGKKIPIILK